MKLTTLGLMISLVVGAAMAQAYGNTPPQCVPEPISMIGLGVAGLGLLRAKMKKA